MATLRTVLNELSAVTIDEWGARGNYDYPDYSDRITMAFVHYNGGPVSAAANAGDVNAEMETLRHDESYHLDNGYHALAYDAAIGQSGTAYEGRVEDRSGATGGDIDLDGIPNNTEAEAILLIIGAGQTPSREMLETLAYMLDRLGLPAYGHRESAEQGTGTVTECPGDEVMAWLERYRNDETSTPDNEWSDTEDVLQNGDTSANVRAWQFRLKVYADYDIAHDGVFGPETEEATRRFQKEKGLDVTGRVTATDWAILMDVAAKRHAASNKSDGTVPPHKHKDVPAHSHEGTVTVK